MDLQERILCEKRFSRFMNGFHLENYLQEKNMESKGKTGSVTDYQY